jgi:hypothetical protein
MSMCCVQVRTCQFKCLKVTDARKNRGHDEYKRIIHLESARLLSERVELSMWSRSKFEISEVLLICQRRAKILVHIRMRKRYSVFRDNLQRTEQSSVNVNIHRHIQAYIDTYRHTFKHVYRQISVGE